MYRGETPGYVVLEDGTVFQGFGFGAPGRVLGEICFNTGMTGYQEVATDPSYHGQMVTFTYPMIGNYGAADLSARVRHGALAGNSRARSEEHQLQPHLPFCVGGVAAFAVGGRRRRRGHRALTRRIREAGAMTACVASGGDLWVNDLLGEVRSFPALSGRDLVREVTCAEPYVVSTTAGRYHVVAYDFGMNAPSSRISWRWAAASRWCPLIGRRPR